MTTKLNNSLIQNGYTVEVKKEKQIDANNIKLKASILKNGVVRFIAHFQYILSERSAHFNNQQFEDMLLNYGIDINDIRDGIEDGTYKIKY